MRWSTIPYAQAGCGVGRAIKRLWSYLHLGLLRQHHLKQDSSKLEIQPNPSIIAIGGACLMMGLSSVLVALAVTVLQKIPRENAACMCPMHEACRPASLSLPHPG